MSEHQHILCLSPAQFDTLEEAVDILALGHKFFNTLEEAVEMIARTYIAEHGPDFEAEWGQDEGYYV